MSHQTGIGCSQELKDFFARAKDGSIRAMKIEIEKEQCVLADSVQPGGTWEEDYDAAVIPFLEEKEACYVLFRLDEILKDQGYMWLLIPFTPDSAQIRSKMLYASTKSTLKQEFGSGNISDELFGTVKEDVTLAGYKRHLISKAAPGPLSMQEEELKLVHELEDRSEINVTTKKETMKGVYFPVNRDAQMKLKDLKERRVNYVQLSLDMTNETVNLADSGSVKVAELSSKIPQSVARYHVYHFNHTYEGDEYNSIIFIYSMPGYKCPIKERMLYSSCKSTLVDFIESDVGIEFTKKMELDTGDEITEDFLLDEVHPKKNLHRPAFSKPTGPAGRRGPRRIVKAADS